MKNQLNTQGFAPQYQKNTGNFLPAGCEDAWLRKGGISELFREIQSLFESASCD
jgi:hypothetical protein